MGGKRAVRGLQLQPVREGEECLWSPMFSLCFHVPVAVMRGVFTCVCMCACACLCVCVFTHSWEHGSSAHTRRVIVVQRENGSENNSQRNFRHIFRQKASFWFSYTIIPCPRDIIAFSRLY